MTSHKNSIIFLFFFSYLIFGLNIVKNYGVSFDEESNRLYGLVNGNYVLKKFLNKEKYNGIFNKVTSEQFSEKIKLKEPTPLFEFADRAYGVIFELPVTALEILLNFDTTYDVYVFRHIMTFLFFFISTFFFYLFLKKIFINHYLALSGVIILISNPRIFAHSFYNSKDIVFLSFFLIAFYFAYSYLEKKKLKNLILLAFFSACAVNIRAIAVVVPLMVYIELILSSIKNKKIKSELIYFPVISLIFLYMIWPFLWENPIENFIYVVTWFKDIPININNYYLGSNHSALNTPWHYLFVWIANTTPLYILILFFAGIVCYFVNFKKYKKLNRTFVYTIVVPLFLVIIFNIALYDGWRHFYFIAPFLIIFCVIFLDIFYHYEIHKYFKLSVALIILAMFVNNIIDMKKLHPYENLYFNKVFIKNPYEMFDKDYWGLTNRIVLENFYKKVKQKDIIYSHTGSILFKTSDFLKNTHDRNFFFYSRITNLDDGPLYLFMNNRYQPPYDFVKKNSETIYEFKMDGVIINGVYSFKTVKDYLDKMNKMNEINKIN